MPDTAVIDVQPAESSTAQTAESFEIPAKGEAYNEWRLTGKAPEAKQPKAASTPAKETPADGGKTPEGKTAPASETGKTQEHKDKPKSTAQTRLDELLADLKTAGFTPAELKTFRKTGELPDSKGAAPAQGTEQTVNPAPELKPPVKPDPRDPKFKTYAELEAAQAKYTEDLIAYSSKKAIADYQAELGRKEALKTITEKLDDARKRYTDADSVIFPTNKAIFDDKAVAPAVKAIVGDSPVFVHLLYALGPERDAFVQLAKTNPSAAIRRAIVMEQLVTAELAKGQKAAEETAARGEDGKFKAAPEKQVTKAPPPPKEVSGRGSPPADEVEGAVKTNDFRAFREAQNRKAFNKHKG
jgi:hypothetical protein